eukprot:GGOE01004435.1.p1 GENE.GGOE01004435.1~~GGOE01004435.1.p1  ORF type:complete len:737 (-),score=224.51 GGOE01004435.1:803-2809(-)
MKALEKPEIIIRMRPGEESPSLRLLPSEGNVLSPLPSPDHNPFSVGSPKLPALPTCHSPSPRGLQPLSPRFPEALCSDSSSFIGAVKADILCLQRKLDQLLGRKEGQVLMTRQIAKYTCSSDPQVDAQVKLRLLEIRDGLMVELEAALHHRFEELAGGCRTGGGMQELFGPKETSLPTLSRLPSFLAILQLLAGLADFRLTAGDKDALLQTLEEQLQEVRDRAGALEMQKDQFAVLHKAVTAEKAQLEAQLQGLMAERDALMEEAKRLRQSVSRVQGEMASLEDRLEAVKKQNAELKEEHMMMKGALDVTQEEMKQLSLDGSSRPCDRCAMVHVQWSSLQQDHAALKYSFHKLTQQKEKLDAAYAERLTQLDTERQRNKVLASNYAAVSKQHRALLANSDSQTRAAVQLRVHYLDFVQGHLQQSEAGQRMALWAQEQEEFDRLIQDALRYRAEVAEAQVLCLSLNISRLPSIAELDELLEEESLPQPVRLMSSSSLLRSISAISLRAASMRRAPSRPSAPLTNAFTERAPDISVDGPSPKMRTPMRIRTESTGDLSPDIVSPTTSVASPVSPPQALKTRLQAAVRELNSLQRPPSNPSKSALRPTRACTTGADDMLGPVIGLEISAPSPRKELDLNRNTRSPVKAFGLPLVDSLAGLSHQPARVVTFT